MRVKAKPFLKWQGGKSRLLPELLKRAPAEFSAYHEPFLGGGALFFELASAGRLAGKRVWLADANAELVQCYRTLGSDFGGVHTALAWILAMHHSAPEETYHRVRATVPDRPALAAARLIYLNKTCFNGLYRVNKKGDFNSPIGTNGRKPDPVIYDYGNLEACAIAVDRNMVALVCQDFRTAIDAANSGDFVFCDPPYAPLSATSSFTAYTKDGFSTQDQTMVHDTALAAKRRGAHVLLSNSSSDLIRDLYAGPEWKIEEVDCNRTGGTAKGRGAVKELLIS